MDNGVSGTDLGSIFTDVKIVGGTLALPNSAPLTMRIDTVGCNFLTDEDPTVWTRINNMEDWTSIPVACQTGGFIKIGGTSLPVVAAQIGWQNVPLDLRQERTYGSPFLDDVTIIQRRLAYDITVKWNNPDLYEQVLNGGAGQTSWSAQPYVADIDIKAISSANMPGQSSPYSLEITAPNIMMSLVGGIQLAGAQAVMMRFQGVAIETTGDYAVFALLNEATDYAWPS